MAKLVFRVQADYEEVVRLRDEIAKLKKELQGMDSTMSPAAFNTLNTQLSASTKKMDELVTEAAKAGAEMEGDFKRKIFDASQVVNGLSEKITLQRGTIQQLKNELSGLKDKYREALKQDGNTSELETKIKEVSAKLRVQKDALFGLTQEQANARLSVKKLRDEYELYRDDSKKTAVATENIGISLKKAFAVFGGAALGKQFISDMIRVRGEFQAADTAIQTLLGSKEKADALMSQVREYAKISPLEFSDVTQATQMMLGFNIESEKVPRFLQAIGDVSMGETQKFNSLTLAFSQMSAAGKLMGQDLNQMINAGFNPLQTMSEKTGKSIAQLKEEMSKGAISAEMVQQAFIDATSAGGRFYQMSENASKTINGQLSMMQDAMDAAFNEMGQKSEGFIMSGIQMSTTLIENYETVGKVLAGLVATYGVYKAALIANITLTQSWAAAAGADAVAKGLQTAATKVLTAAQWALNAAMKANPYVLLATAIAGLASTLWAFTNTTNQAEESQKRLDDATANMRKEIVSEQADIDILFNDLKNAKKGTEEYGYAKDAIINKYGKYLEGLNAEIRSLNNVKGAYDAITAAITKAARARGMETAMRGAQDAYGELYSNNAGKLYDRLREAVGDTKATSMLRKLQKELSNTGKVSQKTREEVSSVFRGSSAYGDSRTWMTSMENATKTLQDETKKIKAVFGDVEKESDKGNKKSVTKNKKYYEDEKKKAQAELDSLTVIEAKGKKGQELRKKIAEYKKDIDAYDASGKSEEKARKATEKRQKTEEKAEKKANEELLKLQQQNRQAQLDLEYETTQKKLKMIDLSYDKQKTEIEKKERELAEQNKKAGAKDLNKKGLTTEQQTEIDNANRINEEARSKQIADAYKDEFAAMRNYLKEYGSFEQQKLAITEEYEQRIREARTKGEELSLQKEKEKALSSLSFKNISMGIDWSALLKGVGSLSHEMLKPMLEKLEAFTKEDEYKKADIAEREKVVQLIQELRKYVGTDQSATWRDLENAIKNFSQAVTNYEVAKAAERKAVEKRADAQNKLKRGEFSKEQFDEINRTAQDLGEDTVKAKDEMQKLGEELNTLSDEVRNRVSPLMKTLMNAKSWNGVEGFGNILNAVGGLDNLKGILDNDVLPKMGEGMAKTIGASLSGAIGSGLSSLGSGLEGLLSSGLGQMVGIIAQIPRMILQIANTVKDFATGILDSFTELISLRWIDDLVNKILEAVGNLVDAIFDLPENLYKVFESVVVNGVGGLVDGVLGRVGNVLTFGALSSGGPSEWFTNSNAEKVANTIDRLTDSNKTLSTALDDLSDEIKAGKGTKSVAAARNAINLQQELNRNKKEIAQAQASYHNSHHSWNYYWGGYNDEQKARLSQQIGRLWSGDLWDLSPEEMKKLRSNPDMWNQIRSTGKGGYGNSVADKLDDYIDQAGKIEEITNELYESLTGISFDGMYDSFVDNLMDMKYNAKAAAEDMSEYFMRAMLSNKIGELYSEKLQQWWEKFGKAMSDNDLTNEERIDLQNEYMGYVNDAIRLRDQLAAITGYDKISSSSQQTATGKSFQTMSQDTGDELNGRFTAMYECDLRREEAVNRQTVSIMAMEDNVLSLFSQVDYIGDIANEALGILADSYMELQEIRENTGAIVKPILQIQRDIVEVKNNTSRL